MNATLKRTAITTATVPTFDRFILDANGTEDTFHIFAADGCTLLGLVTRLATYRGKISRQWLVTGFSKYGSFVFDFEQVEKIVNEALGDPDDADDTDWIFGDGR